MKIYKRIVVWVVIVGLILNSSYVPTVKAESWNKDTATTTMELRFWNDENPDIRFYINAASRYLLETVKEPKVGSTFGEWSVMDLLRGMYTGTDYLNYIPENYFKDYISRVEAYVEDKDGNLHSAKSTEWSRLILALTALGYDITNVSGQYNFIDRLSQSYKFSYRQGINGPIWEIIALNTGGYSLLENPSTFKEGDINTVGKMIDYIANKEITANDGTVGGWALYGKTPDPDITAMALQALAPYYLDENKFNETGSNMSYTEYQSMVERAILILSKIQMDNGGYTSWGSVNSESIAQVIVALTSLNIDPKSSYVALPHVGATCSFIKAGADRDGVTTNNMIDALLTFYAYGSGSSEAVGGFKHVTAGNDGGGGSGTSVNAMATDQALYGLIAYDRFLHHERPLYDMRDMSDGSYVDASPQSLNITWDGNGHATTTTDICAPYKEVKIPEITSTDGHNFFGWNTKADGTGTMYYKDEILSMPEHDITLYAIYRDTHFSIHWELNGGVLSESSSLPESYTPMDDTIIFPDKDHISKDGCKFQGWNTKADGAGRYVTEISSRSYGTKSFYAIWMVDWTPINQFYSLVGSLNSNTISLGDKTTIDQARQCYDNLAQIQKDQITEDMYHSFLEMENKLKAIEQNTAAINQVIERINYLDTDLTLVDKAMVEDVRKAYEQLSDTDKKLITNYKTLVAAEIIIERLATEKAQVDAVMEQIQAIGTVTLESKNQIHNARTAYNALNVKQKEQVGSYIISLLEQAEVAYSQLLESKQRVEDTTSAIEKIPDKITLDENCFEAICKAKALYNQLSTDEKKDVDGKLVEKMYQSLSDIGGLAQKAQTEEDEKKANKVTLQITALPQQDVTLADKEAVEEARKQYDLLDNVIQKVLVENYYALVNMENRIVELELDQEKANAIIKLIEEMGTVTLEKKDMVSSVREQFDQLTSSQKTTVTNLADLTDAESKISELTYHYGVAMNAVDQIKAIGNVTLDSYETIIQARAAYDLLNDVEREYARESVTILNEAEQKYAKIVSQQLRKITVTPGEVTLHTGEQKELTINYEPADTINDKTVTWSSSNKDVVRVENGVLYAKAAGEAVITAKVGALSSVCKVTVNNPITGISMDLSEVTMKIGDQQLLSVSINPTDTTDDTRITWSSSNDAVVSVDNGKIKALAEGTAIITAMVGDKKVNCTVYCRSLETRTETNVLPTIENVPTQVTKEKVTYAIHYKLNKGRNAEMNPVTYTGEEGISLKNPKKAGYTFLGWYLDKTYKKRITTIQQGSTGDLTLYAKWKKTARPKKPVITKVTKNKKKVVRIYLKKKVADITGYELVISQKKKFEKHVKAINVSNSRVLMRKLAGKTCYICICAYRLDSCKKKVYGSYSKIIKVKER